jgi:hypothetical protein
VGANRVLVNGAIIPGRFQAQASKLAERPMISRPPRPWDLVRSEDAVCGAGQTPAVRRRYSSLNVFSSVHFSPLGKLFQLHAQLFNRASRVCCATFSCPGPGVKSWYCWCTAATLVAVGACTYTPKTQNADILTSSFYPLKAEPNSHRYQPCFP